jgi:iron complex transport system substrate-binding protein
MQIVSLNPAFTDILCALDDGLTLRGVTHLCAPSGKECNPSVVTSAKRGGPPNPELESIISGLSKFSIDWAALDRARPSCIVTTVVADNPDEFTASAQEYLTKLWNHPVRITSLEILTLEGLLDAYATLGAIVGKGARGRDLAQRLKSQLLDWGRNLYERLRNKKVVVVSGVSPFEVAGCWVPDIVKLVSGRPFLPDLRKISGAASWQDLTDFAPDVILVAPYGKTLEESVRTLRALEELPNWDSLPAVKRGEVVFSDGVRLYRTGPALVEGAGVLVSAIAGLDSGYITKRDEFHRLRFVELHRHRFM